MERTWENWSAARTHARTHLADDALALDLLLLGARALRRRLDAVVRAAHRRLPPRPRRPRAGTAAGVAARATAAVLVRPGAVVLRREAGGGAGRGGGGDGRRRRHAVGRVGAE